LWHIKPTDHFKHKGILSYSSAVDERSQPQILGATVFGFRVAKSKKPYKLEKLQISARIGPII